MPITKYPYTKTVNPLVLQYEIENDPGIIVALDHIECDEVAVDVWMADVLPGAEETALNDCVTAHSNPTDPDIFKLYGQSGAPSDVYGTDGELRIDTSAKKVYTKSGGAWDSGVLYNQSSGDVPFTPNGDIAASDVQAAIVEVRDDTDTKLSGKLADITGEPLGDLSDVSLTTPASGEVLKFDGADWINQTLAEAGIAAATHTHAFAADLTDTPADYTGAGSNFVKVNSGATALEFVADPGYLLDITGESLGDLSNVVLTSPATNEVLSFNGTNWINSAAAAGQSVDRQIVSANNQITLGTSTWTDITGLSLTTNNLGEAGTYKITFTGRSANSSRGNLTEFRIVVDGVVQTNSQVTHTPGRDADGSDDPFSVSTTWLISGVTSGTVVKVQWSRSSGTSYLTHRSLVIDGVPDSAVV